MRKLIFSILLLCFAGLLNYTFGQDDCASAVDIPIDVYGTCGDMAFTNVDLDGAVPSADAPAPACGSFGAGTNDMWYSFTVPAGVTEMSFHAFDAPTAMIAVPPLLPGAPACGPGMAIYSGNCGALTLIDCYNIPDGVMQNSEIRWELIAGLTPGETIYVRLWEEDNDVTSFFFAASVITSLPESDCANPPALSSAGCNILAPAGTIQAPEDCGWTSTDNVVFYSFEVLAGDPQPVTIDIEFGQCWANDVDGLFPSDPEIQFAVYSWDGISCSDIGGSPLSTPPNNTTYYECRQGTGTVAYSEDLPPGMYVLAMDGFSYEAGLSLCTFGIAASFLEPDAGELDVSLSTVDVGCGQMGSATITINSSCGGNPTIEWSSSVNAGLTENGLAAGPYSVTVTDDDPTCGDTVINFTIADNGNFVVAVTSAGNQCGDDPITLTANVMGANPADCTYAWSPPGGTGQMLVVNDPGTYTVTVTYGTCIANDDITIVDGNFEFSVVYTPTICSGSTGNAQFNLIEGEGPFMYEWCTGSIAPGIQILEPGNCCLTATDLDSGCQDVFCFTVVEVAAIDVTIDSEDISCFGKADGTATAVVTGGTLPYEYDWSIPSSSESLFDLISGTYAVTVEDDNGCTGYATVSIEEPPIFTYTISPSSQGICLGAQANLDVTPSGGVEPYVYSWNDAPALDAASRTVSPMQDTIYTVVVYDANMCEFQEQSANVNVSQTIVIDVITEDILCHGECTATAFLDIEGGVPPYIYTWDSSTEFMQNLCDGDYSVTITDLYECIEDADFSITEPDTMDLIIYSGPATCYGYNDGYVEVEVSGGVPFTNEFGDFYHYEWSFGSDLDSINYYAGTHSVTVTDANACSHIAYTSITQPDQIVYGDPLPWNGQICPGWEFSTAVRTSGGNGPYYNTWFGSNDSIIYGPSLVVSPVETTTYTLVTVDEKGCFGPGFVVTVDVYPNVNIISATSSPASVCIGETIEVEMEASSGNGGPYTFTGDAGIVNMPHSFTPEETGYYLFQASDMCGLITEDSDSIFVTVHPLPTVGFFSDHTSSCPPGIFHFTEITPDEGQTYLWDFGDGGFSVQKNPIHTYDVTGTYDVTLTAWSQNGCERVKEYNNMIKIYPVPRAEFAATPEIVSVLNAQVEFINYSEGGGTYFWDFGDGATTLWTPDMQLHTYYAVGEYDIMMVAKNQFECIDTAYKRVRVHDEFTFYAPDAFSPNGDGLNDLFYVIGHGIDATQFYLCVYDRLGNRVFQTEIFDEERAYRMAWDGSFNGSVTKGDPVLTNGLYSWYCTFVDFTGKPHEESGTVTLVR